MIITLTSIGLPNYDWSSKLPEIFGYTRWFMGQSQYFVMMAVAICAAVGVVSIILDIFGKREEKAEAEMEDEEDW